MDGWFKAADARRGDVLWRYQIDSGLVGQPITSRGPDGRQYVAVPRRRPPSEHAREKPALADMVPGRELARPEDIRLKSS